MGSHCIQHGSVAQLQLALAPVCAMTITTISQNRCFGGVQGTYAHESTETGCAMRFGVFLPPQAGTLRVPLLYWL